ncbi:MAG: hypothetical protein ACKO2Z_07120, partial [Sphaerospermopsis kisseleviana]
LFGKLFLHNIDSTQYQQALSKIYNILVIKKFLQLPDSSKKDYGKAIEQNCKWLTKPLIVITPDLQTLLENYLENYCQHHPQADKNNLIIKLDKHLNNLKLHP